MTKNNFERLQDGFRILLGADAKEQAALARNYVLRAELAAEAEKMAQAAYAGDHHAYEQMHEFLFAYYNAQFSMVKAARTDIDPYGTAIDLVTIFETAILADEERHVNWSALPAIPENGSDFLRWFQDVAHNHPAWNHPFYLDFLANRAGVDDFRYYLTQETTLDPRFDDLLALIQIGTSGDIKMEIANNYWDEMGAGQEAEVHTVLFARALEELGADQKYIAANTSLASKASGNLSSMMGMKRRHFYKAIGYFGITEYMAPHRFKRVLEGWRRNKLPAAGIVYHDLHIGVDAGHSLGWMHNVIVPLIDRDPAAAAEIARGAVYRLNSSARYLGSLSDERVLKEA